MDNSLVSQRTMRTLTAPAVVLATATAADASGAPLRIGAVTWHPKRHAGQVVGLVSYALARKVGYAFFSDEPRGRVSPHNLPVVVKDIAGLKLNRRYRIRGRSVRGGLKARNGNVYHLELAALPILASH